MKLQILQLLFVIVSISYEAHADCITTVALGALTGDQDYAGFGGNSHKMVLKVRGKDLTADIPPPADRNSEYTSTFSMADDFGVAGCVSRFDIDQVRIEAGGNDGWYIASAFTSIIGESGVPAELTSNPTLDVWVDGNEEDSYSYDAKVLVLSLHDCISSITVTATTGGITWAGSSSPHNLVVVLAEGPFDVALTGAKLKNEVYTKKVALSDISTGLVCVQKGDIKQVRIEESGNDGWYITDVKVETDSGVELAGNNPFNLWVDGNDEYDYTYNAKRLVLKLA